MSPALAQRQVGLAAVALLAAVAVLAVTSSHASSNAGSQLPRAVHWYRALAAPYSPAPGQKLTACGQRVGASLEGIAHPVLQCGVKLFVSYGGHDVLTQVVDRGPAVPGRQFDLTRALADRIGLYGTQQVRWSFAR